MLRLSRWFAVAAVLFIPLSAGAQDFCPPVAYAPSYGYGGSGYAPSYGYGGYNPGGLGGPWSGLGVRPGLGLGGFGLRR